MTRETPKTEKIITTEEIRTWAKNNGNCKVDFTASAENNQPLKAVIIGESHNQIPAVQAQAELIRLMKPPFILMEGLMAGQTYDPKTNTMSFGGKTVPLAAMGEPPPAFKIILEVAQELGIPIYGVTPPHIASNELYAISPAGIAETDKAVADFIATTAQHAARPFVAILGAKHLENMSSLKQIKQLPCAIIIQDREQPAN